MHGYVDFEGAISSIASQQDGVVTREQLQRAGVSPDAVDRRVKAGRLKRVYQGVYLAGPIAGLRAREMAAALACPGCVLSYWSAASCWQMLLTHEQPDVHVTVGGRRPTSRPGLRIHRVARLRTDEITTLGIIPITTPARTLYDLASCTEQRELERAMAGAFALRLTSSAEVAVLASRYPGRRGTRRLRELLERDTGPALTRSQAEEQFLALIRRSTLRDPEVNVRIESYEVDFLWRPERLVVEVDGRAFHSSDRTFESDRRRDGVLLAAGLRVMRVTWRQIVSEPEAILVRLTRALSMPPRD